MEKGLKKSRHTFGANNENAVNRWNKITREGDTKPHIITEDEFLSRLSNGEQAIITGVQDKCYSDHFKTAKNAHVCLGNYLVVALGTYFMDYKVCDEGYSSCALYATGFNPLKSGAVNNGALIRAIINRDAKVVSLDYLNDVRRVIGEKHTGLNFYDFYLYPVSSRLHNFGLLLSYCSAFAKILGYDIVKAGECFYIYNRGALLVCEKDLELTLDEVRKEYDNPDLQFTKPFIMDKDFKIPENFDYSELENSETIKVDPENPYYTYENGILYNKDKSIIIFAKADQVLDLDSSIQKIEVQNFKTGNHFLFISNDFHPSDESFLEGVFGGVVFDSQNPYYRYNCSTYKIEKRG